MVIILLFNADGLHRFTELRHFLALPSKPYNHTVCHIGRLPTSYSVWVVYAMPVSKKLTVRPAIHSPWPLIMPLCKTNLSIEYYENMSELIPRVGISSTLYLRLSFSLSF